MCMPKVQSGDKRWSLEKGGNREERISLFTQCRGLTLRFHSVYNKHALLHRGGLTIRALPEGPGQ
ncbi:unnamed protein product [Staurois parvus]|uniref:Uncharacterized protein n=1 Tax=Staurois parvus TaxID=386267 RepID=A0ABN9B7I9_9NEOB|nr:unnamed protein product [Staurois parvus]